MQKLYPPGYKNCKKNIIIFNKNLKLILYNKKIINKLFSEIGLKKFKFFIKKKWG